MLGNKTMLSIIAPIAGNDPLRMKNFRMFAKCVLKQSRSDQHFPVEYEFIVVEQEIDGLYYKPILEEVGVSYSHISAKHNMFNKSWLCNIGAKRASGSLFMFMDADVGFGKDYFEKILNHTSVPYMLGWNKAVFLTEKGIKAYVSDTLCKTMAEGGAIERTVESLPGGKRHPSSCMGLSNIFNRNFFFEQLGGYNESFTKWGGEDCDIMLRAEKAAGEWYDFDYTLYHFNHGGRVRGKKNDIAWEKTRIDPESISSKIKSVGSGHMEGPRPIW